MRTVFSFIKPYQFHAIVAFSLMLLELSIELVLPLLLGIMIDQGVMEQNMNQIIFWGSIMIGLSLIALLIGILNSFYSSHVSFSFAYDLRKKLFKKIQHLSFENLGKYPSSALVTRFTNDIRQIQTTVFMGLRIMAKAPLLVFGGIAMSFFVNFRLASIFLIIVPIVLLFLLWVMNKAGKKFLDVQESVDEVNRVMQENLTGIRLIKAFTRSAFERSRFAKANQQLADTSKSTFRFVEATFPILFLMMNMSIIFILWFGSAQSIAGTIDVGEVVTIVNYALRVAMAISMFSFIIMLLSRTKASAERVDDVLSIHETTAEDGSTTAQIEKGKVVFDRVSFRYPGDSKQVLQDVSFTVPAQGKLAVIGATGAGKTTVFQLLPRLYEPTEGMIYIDDVPITAYSYSRLRKSIGYVPQSPLLFSGTIRENIAWGKNDATMEEVMQAAKDAQIHDTIMNLENQYETRVGQKGVNLSGGQKQRISIARALIRKPKILLLDDSTSALDLQTEANLLDAIETYQCTMIIITQKIATAKRADRIVLLDEGEILASGTHEELLQQSALYGKIVRSQSGKEYEHANK